MVRPRLQHDPTSQRARAHTALSRRARPPRDTLANRLLCAAAHGPLQQSASASSRLSCGHPRIRSCRYTIVIQSCCTPPARTLGLALDLAFGKDSHSPMRDADFNRCSMHLLYFTLVPSLALPAGRERQPPHRRGWGFRLAAAFALPARRLLVLPGLGG